MISQIVKYIYTNTSAHLKHYFSVSSIDCLTKSRLHLFLHRGNHTSNRVQRGRPDFLYHTADLRSFPAPRCLTLGGRREGLLLDLLRQQRIPHQGMPRYYFHMTRTELSLALQLLELQQHDLVCCQQSWEQLHKSLLVELSPLPRTEDYQKEEPLPLPLGQMPLQAK